MVGTGTAASCTDAALDAALASGVVVAFDCGGPATIDISTGTGTKTVAADTTIDGGGLITISGGNVAEVFVIPDGVNFTVQNLTVANGRLVGDSGGGIMSWPPCDSNPCNQSFSLLLRNTIPADNLAAYPSSRVSLPSRPTVRILRACGFC